MSKSNYAKINQSRSVISFSISWCGTLFIKKAYSRNVISWNNPFLPLLLSHNCFRNFAAKIQSGEIPYDVAIITKSVTEKLSGGDDQLIILSTLGIMICWIVGIADSYRVGRIQDKNGTS